MRSRTRASCVRESAEGALSPSSSCAPQRHPCGLATDLWSLLVARSGAALWQVLRAWRGRLANWWPLPCPHAPPRRARHAARAFPGARSAALGGLARRASETSVGRRRPTRAFEPMVQFEALVGGSRPAAWKPSAHHELLLTRVASPPRVDDVTHWTAQAARRCCSTRNAGSCSRAFAVQTLQSICILRSSCAIRAGRRNT